MSAIRGLGNHQIRIYPRTALLAYSLSDDVFGFYVMLALHSGADPLIPADVVREFGKYKRRRYFRELDKAGLAFVAPRGALCLAEHQPADKRWRYFGSPRELWPFIAVSFFVKPVRSPLPRQLRREVIARDEGVCGICGLYVQAGERLDIDHIVPLARGGTDDLSNLQVSHASCNRSKGARLSTGAAG